MRRSRILFALVLSVAACGGSNKSTQSTDPKLTTAGSGSGSGTASGSATPDKSSEIPADLLAKTDRAVSFVEQLAVAAEKNGPDCTKIATALQTVVNGPDGSAIKDVDSDPRFRDYSKQIGEKYMDKTDQLSERLSTALQGCHDSKEIDEVLTKAGLGGPPPGEGQGDADGDTDEAPPASNE